MSTSRSRLTRSIQAIAKQDPDLRRAIEATKPRGDQPSAAGVGISDAERDRICCDGSVSGDANPGTEERDTSEGGMDASDGLNSDNPADIGDMGPGSLTGLHDCATGEPVCFEGGGWVPPDGWDSPTAPPLADGYSDGYYWQVRNVNGVVDGTRASHPGGAASLFSDDPTIYAVYATESRYDLYRTNELGNTILLSSWVQRVPCGDSTELYCTEVPYESSWPSDSCVNLAIKSGSIVGSKYDPENDGSYSKPMSEIKLCDDFGNSFYLRPSANGGWKTINATKDAGYLWGSSGQKIAHINGNEYSDPSM